MASKIRHDYEELLEIHADMREQFVVHLEHIEQALNALQKALANSGYKSKRAPLLTLMTETRQRITWLKDVSTGLEASRLVYQDGDIVLQ